MRSKSVELIDGLQLCMYTMVPLGAKAAVHHGLLHLRTGLRHSIQKVLEGFTSSAPLAQRRCRSYMELLSSLAEGTPSSEPSKLLANSSVCRTGRGSVELLTEIISGLFQLELCWDLQ